MASPTPGPWHAQENLVEHINIFDWMGQEEGPPHRPVVGRCIATLQAGIGTVFSKDEQWANARLIAAAPELLEAADALLKHIAHSDSMFDGFRYHETLRNLYKAVAKAEGR